MQPVQYLKDITNFIRGNKTSPQLEAVADKVEKIDRYE
jgi:hypothetical protein